MSKVKKIFGGGSQPAPVVDNSAEIARKQEEERQAAILEGKGRIDTAFSRFTPEYYGGIKQSYLDYYNPQLEKQYKDALENLTYSLARSGNALSSTSSEQKGDLFGAYEDKRREITDRAAQAAANARAQVESQKSNLYGLNSSSADPALAASRASAAAVDLEAPQTYSPLGDVFASFINTAANANNLNKAVAPVNLPEPNYARKLNSSVIVN